jgi:hypothetical protein
MNFSARVLKQSHLHRTWVRSNFIAKDFFGVRFVKQKGEYIAERITSTAQLAELQNHPSIELSMITEPSGAVLVADLAPEAEAEVESEPAAVPLEPAAIVGVGKARLRQGKVVGSK